MLSSDVKREYAQKTGGRLALVVLVNQSRGNTCIVSPGIDRELLIVLQINYTLVF